MEGIPRVPMLAAEIKVSAAELQPEFRTKIKQHIAEHYMADPTQFDAAINEIEDLRKKICQYFIDPESLLVMKRYYAQMLMVKMRFPMEENDPVAVPFAWYDRIMEMPTPAVFEDINFELACILYNIGTFHGNLGAVESRVDPDSIKNAFNHFQQAAGPLKHMRDEMNLGKFGTTDFENSVLTWYINLYLNQAQECLLEKSMIDHKKPMAVATVAFFLHNSYRSCRKHLDESSVGEVVSSSRFKEWVRTCSTKSNLYAAIGHLYLGIKADDEKKFGLRVAHYNLALEFIKAAEKDAKNDKRESMRQSLIFAFEVIAGKQKNAEKENDFIYHERIPKFEDLEIPEGQLLAKPVSFDAQDRSILGDDLFAQLLPVSVIKAISVYEEQKTNLRRKVEERIDRKNEELEDYFRRLNLDEINVDSEPDKLALPEDLLTANATFSAQPEAFAEIVNKLHELGNRSREAEAKLNELKVRLDAIDLPEIISDKGYEVISRTLQKRIELFTENRDKDTNLQNTIADESEHIRILSMPISEFKKTIVGTVPKLEDSEDGRKLKRILDKVDEMRLQRIQLLESLKADLSNDDIRGRLLTEKHEDNSDLFEKELRKHDKQILVIDQNLAAQENILSALTDANAQYSTVRQQAVEMAQRRMDQILTLVNAYDVFKDVHDKAGAGIKFYSQLLAESMRLEPSISGMEEHCQKVKKEQQGQQRALEEKMRELQMKADTNDTMALFGYSEQQNPSVPPPVAPSVAGRRERASKDRPRIDFMEFYRNKMAEMSGGTPLPPVPSRAPPPQVLQQPSFPPAPVNYSMPSATPSTRSLDALRQQLAARGPAAGAPSFPPVQQQPPMGPQMPNNFVAPSQAVPGGTPYQLPFVPPPVSPSGSSSPGVHLGSHGNDFQTDTQYRGNFGAPQQPMAPSGFQGMNAAPQMLPQAPASSAVLHQQPQFGAPQPQYLSSSMNAHMGQPSQPVSSSYVPNAPVSSSYQPYGQIPGNAYGGPQNAQQVPQAPQHQVSSRYNPAFPTASAPSAGAPQPGSAGFYGGQPHQPSQASSTTGAPQPGSVGFYGGQPPQQPQASSAAFTPFNGQHVSTASMSVYGSGFDTRQHIPISQSIPSRSQQPGAPFGSGVQNVPSVFAPTSQFAPIARNVTNVTPSVQGEISSTSQAAPYQSAFASVNQPNSNGVPTVPVQAFSTMPSGASTPAQPNPTPQIPFQQTSQGAPRPPTNQPSNPSTGRSTPANPQLGRPPVAPMPGFYSPFAPPANQMDPLLNGAASSPWHRCAAAGSFAPSPLTPAQLNTQQQMPPQAPGQWTQQSQPVRPQVQQQAPAPAPQPVQPIHQVQQVQQAHPPPQPPLQPQPQQIQPDKPSNVDLLSSLMDDPLGISHLPAPLTPSQSSTTRVVTVLDGPGPGETTNLPPPLAPNNAVSKCSPQEPTPAVVTTTQPLQHSAPTPQQVHSELSTPQLSVPEPSVFEQPSEPKVEPQPRPSASVLPIIQPSQSSSSLQSVEQHTLSMSTVTSVNYVAQPSEKTDKEIDNRNSMDLSSLLNPATFQIGPSDDTRFQKRLARNQFNQPLPPLDPSDPLNKLDANFFRKS